MKKHWYKTHRAPASQPPREDPSVQLNGNRQAYGPRKLFVDILLALWFSLLTSFASVSVLVLVSTLCYPLNLKGTYYLVEDHKEQVLWLVVLLFTGLSAWLIADILRSKRLLSDDSTLTNFLYVSLLASKIVSFVFYVSIAIVAVSLLVNIVLPEEAAVPLSSLAVLLVLYYVWHGSRAKPRDRNSN